jgi:Na+/proline symporter
MKLFRRDWTAVEAEEWTAHDFWASVFSAGAYVFTTLGVAGALLLRPWGFVALALAIACVVLMFRVIDPKLRAISAEFESREAHYLEQLDKTQRWEQGDER